MIRESLRRGLLGLMLIFVTALILGCGDDDTDGDAGVDGDVDTDSDPDSRGSDRLGFGEPCEDNPDCASNLCHEFGQVGKACTITCEKPEDCPVGSEGQKCNKQGVCRV